MLDHHRTIDMSVLKSTYEVLKVSYHSPLGPSSGQCPTVFSPGVDLVHLDLQARSVRPNSQLVVPNGQEASPELVHGLQEPE